MMFNAVVGAIMLGSLPIQAQLPPEPTVIVESAPEVGDIYFAEEIKKIKETRYEPIEAPEIQPIAKLDIKPVPKPKVAQTASTSVRRASAPGGWFDPYQCTGYVASRRPVGQWNNASEWYWQAQRDGWSTGLSPQAGAIGVAKTGNHVVYIESVKGDMVYISERNYDYKGSYREIWQPASKYRYIY